MSNPEIHALEREQWQLFGTVTSQEWELSRVRWHKVWFTLARKIAKDSGVYFPALSWVLREERGEITGKAHIHFLLGGLPWSWVTNSNCFRTMHWCRPAAWQIDPRTGDWLRDEKGDRVWDAAEDSMRVGFARIRVFNRRLAGVDYVTKCLSGLAANDEYEFRKFGGDVQELTLSDALRRRVLRGYRDTGFQSARLTAA